MVAYINRSIFRAASSGTGSFVVDAAIDGFRLPEDCVSPAVVNASEYYYFAESDDKTEWEIGIGKYTTADDTLTRATIYDGTNGTSAVDFTAAPKVYMGCPLAQVGGRERLTAARTYYVRTDGSDSNTGLANTSGGAFLTIQKAYNVAITLDCNGFDVTIKLGNTGTFSGSVSCSYPPIGGNLIIEGDTSTPSNTVVDHSSSTIIWNNPGTLTCRYFKITSGNVGILCRAGAVTVSTNVVFGACTSHGVRTIGSYVSIGDVEYTANCGYAFGAALDGIIEMAVNTVTLTGSPVFNIAFVEALEGGTVSAFSVTFSGSAGATTPRYTATLNGSINTYGGGASYFPGTSAGSTSTGGQYA